MRRIAERGSINDFIEPLRVALREAPRRTMGVAFSLQGLTLPRPIRDSLRILATN